MLDRSEDQRPLHLILFLSSVSLQGRDFLLVLQACVDTRPFTFILWQATPHPASSVGHLLPWEKARPAIPHPLRGERVARVRRFHQPARDG